MFEVQPIGYIRKNEGQHYIEILPEFHPGLSRLEMVSHIFILW